MKKITLIMILTLISGLFFTFTAEAEILIENKKIDFNLSPAQIKRDSYLPLTELADNNLITLTKINKDKYFILTKKACYQLETEKKIIRVNKEIKILDNPPIRINGHFLIPVEFISKFLGLNISSAKSINSDHLADIKTKDDLSLKVYLNDNKVKEKKKLKVKIEIMNLSKNDLILKFNSSQKYNIKLFNKAGKIIYSWEKGKMFSQALQEIKVSRKDSLIFTEKIDLSQFKRGKYNLEINFLAANYNFDIIKKEFEISESK